MPHSSASGNRIRSTWSPGHRHLLGPLCATLVVATACAPAAPPPSPTAVPAPTSAPAPKPTSPPPAAAGAPTTAPKPAAPVADSPDVVRDSQVTVDTSKWKKDPPWTIAAITQGPGNGWGLTFDTTIKAAAAANPQIKKLLFSPANGDANQEISAMEDAIQQKPDAIVVDPLSPAALAAPVNRAMAAGIPVVLCADTGGIDNFVSRVDVDLYRAGFQSGDGLAKLLNGKGNVIMFSGIPGVAAAETWKKAAEAAFQQYPGIKIVGNEYAEWSIATSKLKTEALMAANPQIDGVWAGGGEMALGAAFAFRDAKKAQPQYGFTNVLNGFLRVAKESDLKFNGVPYPPSMSKVCLDTALDILQGKPVKKYVAVDQVLAGSAPYDQSQIEKYYVPTLNDDFVPPAAVPVEAYLQAGFGRK